VRFEGTAYRAHDPRWSFTPLSGEGAALRGARFNPKGMPALYLSLEVLTAIKEANQGFARKIDPCVLCSYEIACDDIADLRTEAACAAEGVDFDDLDCPWFALLAAGREPPTWPIVRRLLAAGRAGMLVPSFATGAVDGDHNLVLWLWDRDPPHRVDVYDPSGRLPMDQLSWRE
jgi:RES domain-containing protein